MKAQNAQSKTSGLFDYRRHVKGLFVTKYGHKHCVTGYYYGKQTQNSNTTTTVTSLGGGRSPKLANHGVYSCSLQSTLRLTFIITKNPLARALHLRISTTGHLFCCFSIFFYSMKESNIEFKPFLRASEFKREVSFIEGKMVLPYF